MRSKRIRRCICLLLIASQLGCRSAYDLNLSSKPTGATVTIGGLDYGTTPVTVTIDKENEAIEDQCVDITFTLPDGRTITQTCDLREYARPNFLVQCAAGILVVPGTILLKLASDDDEDDDEEDNDDKKSRLTVGVIGLALVGLGALVYGIFGGGSESNDILVIFKDAPR